MMKYSMSVLCKTEIAVVGGFGLQYTNRPRTKSLYIRPVDFLWDMKD
ncbi:MAG: hypothetical protein ACKPKO_61590 [Candidatus Fonsibacter sp.]